MNQKKVARICWNTNNWQFPSGKAGKVSDTTASAYETKTGYGAEEWLFDISKLVNGYHYGYIQAIGQHRGKYEGEKFDISFYTINSVTKERWWLGEVVNVQVVSKPESKSILATYKRNHWLREMYAQLVNVSADLDEFKRIQPDEFCCIKFKPSDMQILEEPRQFLKGDPAVRSDYYNLKNNVGVPSFFKAKIFSFIPGATTKNWQSTATYRSHSKDIDLVHNQIQAQIFALLKKAHGKENVASELDTGYGTRVDLVVRSAIGLTFYELKTSNTAKQCIREALSQLLEYSYYPNAERAAKLVIVAPIALSKDSRRYLAKLRNIFHIPIAYQQFDLELKALGPEE